MSSCTDIYIQGTGCSQKVSFIPYHRLGLNRVQNIEIIQLLLSVWFSWTQFRDESLTLVNMGLWTASPCQGFYRIRGRVMRVANGQPMRSEYPALWTNERRAELSLGRPISTFVTPGRGNVSQWGSMTTTITTQSRGADPGVYLRHKQGTRERWYWV